MVGRGKPMERRQGKKEFLGRQRRDIQRARGAHRRDDGEIHRTVDDASLQFHVAELEQLTRTPGEVLLERGQQLRHEVGRHRGVASQANLSGLHPQVLAQDACGFISPEENGLGQRRKSSPSGVRAIRRLPRSNNRVPSSISEPPHLVAEGRLRDPQHVGGLGEAQHVGDGDEVLELGEFQDRAPIAAPLAGGSRGY